ncbi:MAG: hypothetical protein RL205_1723 [Actinomycetota bacterium]|jgi:hypothetical protein
MRLKKTAALGIAAAAACTLAIPAQADSGFLYMEPVASGVTLKPLLTTGDSIGGVTWAGVPDGMGVLKDGNNLTIFVNHELATSNKAAAALGHNGVTTSSTVSALNYDTTSGAITGVRDLINKVDWFDYATGQRSSTPGAPAGADAKDSYGGTLHGIGLNRFCSSHLTQPGELAYRVKGKDGTFTTYGYTGPAYFTAEENGDESRAFVLDNSGNLVQLPKVGLAGTENLLLEPGTGRATVLMVNEDNNATDSQLRMYVGQKETEGSWYQKAGLDNGQAYVMAVNGIATDNAFRSSVGKGVATVVSWRPINTTVNGKAQGLESLSLGTTMSRIEDGEWDPNHPSDYYFITTESNKDKGATAPNPAEPTVSRDGGALWRYRVTDPTNPVAGGTLTMLLDGTEAPYLSKPDNLTISGGNILIQEDPGNNAHISRLVSYRLSDGKLGTVLKFKDEYFKTGGAGFLTIDEESSGVIDVTDFLKTGKDDQNNYFLLDAQVHTATGSASRPDLNLTAAQKAALDALTVEGGQLYLMTITPAGWVSIYS